MKCGGIDIGSRYIKYVLIEDGRIVSFQRRETGHSPLEICSALIRHDPPGRLVATGYGRYLLEVHGNSRTITEIKAVARGAKEMFPSCRTVIDIGGQDTKVISLTEDGAVKGFEMNDRCAAGTGRFIEIMARALGFALEDFGAERGSEENNVRINSMCTVFAESEVVGLIAKGVKRETIADALQRSIVQRVFALLTKVVINDDVVFAGGCARNQGLAGLFEERLDSKILIDRQPEMLSALGAALYAAEGHQK